MAIIAAAVPARAITLTIDDCSVAQSVSSGGQACDDVVDFSLLGGPRVIYVDNATGSVASGTCSLGNGITIFSTMAATTRPASANRRHRAWRWI